MSTIHDLRQTLSQHADALDDTGRQERTTAVRRRVRTARRRRAAATVVAASLVVAGGVGAVATFQAPQERADVAGLSVVGVPVPEEIAIHGFPYELSDQFPIEGEDAGISLDGDQLQALSLVGTGLGSGSATLYVDGEAVSRVFAGDPVAVPVPVRPSELELPLVRVKLHGAPADARTGVAIYDATGELAPGVDNGEVVFRDVVAGDRLLTADFAEKGQTRATLTFERPLSATLISVRCLTEERRLWVWFSIGDQRQGAECSPGDDPDLGGGSFAGDDRASGRHTIGTVVTRGPNGPVVEDADVQLGIATYEPGDTTPVGGMNIDTVVEHAGRTWQLDTELTGDVGASARTVVADTDVLLGFVTEADVARLTWKGELTSGSTDPVGFPSSPRATGYYVDGLLLRGDTYGVELVSKGQLADGALLVYRPL